MRKTFLAVGLAFGAGACSGLLTIPQGQFVCKTDSDCPATYKCLQQICEQISIVGTGCNACKVTEACDQNGKCITPDCSPTNLSGSCPLGQGCQGGGCVDITDCKTGGNSCAAACPNGLCTLAGTCCVSGACYTCAVPDCSPSALDGRCPAGSACVNGTCIVYACSLAHTDGSCQPDWTCQAGVCVQLPCGATHLHGRCDPGNYCSATGQCAVIGTCDLPADCPPHFTCEAPNCVRDCTCKTSDDCFATEHCANGTTCLPSDTCINDSDCSDVPSSSKCSCHSGSFNCGSSGGLGTCLVTGACTSACDCSGAPSTPICSPFGELCVGTGGCCGDQDCLPGQSCIFSGGLTCESSPRQGGVCTYTATACHGNDTYANCINCPSATTQAECAVGANCSWGTSGPCVEKVGSTNICCPVGQHCSIYNTSPTQGVCINNGQCVTSAECFAPYFTCDTTSMSSTMYTCLPYTTEYNCLPNGHCATLTCAGGTGGACKCSSGGACIPSTTAAPHPCAVGGDCGPSEVCNPLFNCEVIDCGSQTIPSTLIEPNMVIVQDISGSMNTAIPTANGCTETTQPTCAADTGCLWTQCTGSGTNCISFPTQLICQANAGCTWNAAGTCVDPTRFQTGLYVIDAVVDSYSASKILFGVSRFAQPGGGACGPGVADVQAGTDLLGTTIEGLLAGTVPSSSTPTAQTFAAIAANPTAFGLPKSGDTTARPNYALLCTDGQANCQTGGDYQDYMYRNVNAVLDQMRSGKTDSRNCPSLNQTTSTPSCIVAGCNWTGSSCVTPIIKTFVAGFQFDVFPNELNSNAVHGGTARTDNDCPPFRGDAANCPKYDNESQCNASVYGGVSNLCVWDSCSNWNGSQRACQAVAGCSWNPNKICNCALGTNNCGCCTGAGTVGTCDYNVDVPCHSCDPVSGVCNTLSQAACGTQPICTWLTNCGNYTMSTSCTDAGCTWAGCSPQTGSQSGCQAITGCNWASCASMTANRTGCKTASDGCTWNACNIWNNNQAVCQAAITAGAACTWNAGPKTCSGNTQNGGTCTGTGGICSGSGGTCNNQCGFRFCYYPATNPAELLTAFQDISGSIASCNFQLTLGSADSSRLAVYWTDANGASVPADSNNGWQFYANTNTMIFNGTSCDIIKRPVNPLKPYIVVGCTCNGPNCIGG